MSGSDIRQNSDIKSFEIHRDSNLSKFTRLYQQILYGCEDEKCRNPCCRNFLKKRSTKLLLDAYQAKILAFQFAQISNDDRFRCNSPLRTFIQSPDRSTGSVKGDCFMKSFMDTVVVKNLFQPVNNSSSSSIHPPVSFSREKTFPKSDKMEDVLRVEVLNNLISKLSNLEPAIKILEVEAISERLKHSFSDPLLLLSAFKCSYSCEDVFDFKYGISTKLIDEYFHLLSATTTRETKTFMKTIISALVQLLKQTIAKCHKWRASTKISENFDSSNLGLSLLIFMLASPLLCESTEILKVFAILTSKLHHSVKQSLVISIELLFRSTPEKFEALVKATTYILISKYEKVSTDGLIELAAISGQFSEPSLVVACMKLLRILFDANEYYTSNEMHTKPACAFIDGYPLRTIIPFYKFYCTSKNYYQYVFDSTSVTNNTTGFIRLPYKRMYLKYTSARLNGSSENDQFTSIMDYPFLMDPVSKMRLFRLEALSFMNQGFDEVMVKQGLISNMRKIMGEQGESPLQVLERNSKRNLNPYLVLNVRRERIVADTIRQLNAVPFDNLRKPLKIRFQDEEGLDQGGIQKEFFQLFFAEILRPEHNVVAYNTETRLHWICNGRLQSSQFLEAVGCVLGLAFYNGIMLDLNFPIVFYKKLIQKDSLQFHLDDLAQLQPETYKGLKILLEWDRKNGDVQEVFNRNFEISIDRFGDVETIDLCESGHTLPVDNDNRHEFVRMYVKFLLSDAVKDNFQPIRVGFDRIMTQLNNFHVFRAEELQIAMTGLSSQNDNSYSSERFLEIKENAKYVGFDGFSNTVKQFWDVVILNYDNRKRKRLLWFFSASDRIPLGGLKEIRLTIQKHGGNDNKRLPTASTCFNTIFMPEYDSKEAILKMFDKALNESQGFGLV